MSKPISFDPLLVRHLAEELNRQLRGRACAAAPLFDSDRSVVLPLDRGEALRLDLHPTRGWVRMVPWDTETETLDGTCLEVDAPPDERVLRLRLRAGDRFRITTRVLVVELHTNQWNALLVSEDDGRILSVLRSRTAGERELRSGQPYVEPPPPERFGAGETSLEQGWARWRATLELVEPHERRSVLLRNFAYLGSVNVDAVLGSAGTTPGETELRAAFERWWRLRSLDHPQPVLVRTGGRTFPYPTPLPGWEAERVDSLLAGMARVAAAVPTEQLEELEREQQRRRVERRVAAAARKVARLEDQLAQSGEAERMRTWGDLLLAHLHLVPRGAQSVRLTDWEDREVEIDLDPTLTPADNASRWYDGARRRARADERIPGLLEEARAELSRWEQAATAVAAGDELPEWAVRELARSGSPAASTGREADAESQPYRVYRTSGGLEVRVGRSSRDNDRLTFGHSSPNDVWLHARSVPGSHVILRWRDPDGAPPARDLEEAAGLAALFSKARTSALVPVDWTRRKYVRKPRGAPPGAVIPQRLRTVFVEPDPALEERLREG